MAQKNKGISDDLLVLIRPEIRKVAKAITELLPPGLRTGSTSEVLTRGLGVIARRLESKGGKWRDFSDFVGEIGDAIQRSPTGTKMETINVQEFLKGTQKRLLESQNPAEEMERMREEFRFMCEMREEVKKWEESQGAVVAEREAEAAAARKQQLNDAHEWLLERINQFDSDCNAAAERIRKCRLFPF